MHAAAVVHAHACGLMINVNARKRALQAPGTRPPGAATGSAGAGFVFAKF